MRREVECVLAHERLGLFRLAALQGLDDGEMVHHGAVGPIVLADGRLPYGPHVDEEVLGHLLDHLAAAEADDRLVKGDVRLGVLVHVLVGMAALEAGRSEEHTSELQSLMRISYAVFCLKKKNDHLLMIVHGMDTAVDRKG